MFNKKALSLAVAAAASTLSLATMAQIDVTNNTGQVKIANESVTPTTTGVLPVGPGTSGSTALNVTGDLGIGVAADDQVFVRFDWSGASLAGDLGLNSITVQDGTAGAPINSTSLSDGQAADTNAIFGVTADTNGFSQTSTVTLDIGTSGLLLSGTSDVRMRVFETQTNAINETFALSDQSLANAVTLADALDIDFDPETAVAEVTEDFEEFTTGDTGTLGSYTASALTGFVLATGLTSVTTLGDLVSFGTNSIVTYTGDFSFATGTGYFMGNPTCSDAGGATVSPNTSNFQTATVEVDVSNTLPLCVTVNGTDEVIPETSYDASVVLAHSVTTSSPSSTSDNGIVGEIDRNGTTVEVAYLTTFSDYNQRLLINSRHPVVAEYRVEFQTEDGVTATALPAATGVLQPGENLVLRAIDIVEITGGTRCSATVTVVAPQNNISVATTQVNLSDASTDTVSYN